MRPPEKLLELEEQFVRLLIVNMSDVDVGVFDFDFDTTFAVLAMNQDKQVYLRYGGRDSKSAESFVSTASLEKALTRGLDLHKQWRLGKLALPAAGPSKSSSSYPFVATAAGRRCVHCHDVASGKAIEMLNSPKFDLLRDVWIYPEPKSLGLDVDPDDGTVLRSTSGVAAKAGLKAGDQVVALDTKPVSTYSDIQYHLHRLPPDTDHVSLTLADGRTGKLPLPKGWRYSDITWRRLGLRLSPSAGFGGTPLSAERKSELELPVDSFATEVSFYDFPKPPDSPLKQGDIVVSVNGIGSSQIINHAALFVTLTAKVGDVVELGVIRRGEKLTIPLTVSDSPSQNQRIMDSDARRRGGGRGGKRQRGGATSGDN